MWEIPSRAAPPGFLEGVMAEVKSREMSDYSGPVEKTLYKPLPRSPGTKPTFRKGRWETLRDLTLAAAVSLAVFWYGGAWFSNENIVSAGSKLDLAFKSYVQYSGGTLNRVYSNVEDLNGTLLKER
ncbi:hypothetical protein DCCM_0161 [Desulfocucumis palustris]|uniref:Uncharacterized protein n=2 Tax=Desulfocucumis palustris TaxID=1898651 RepID=A0A2L2XDS2_9FIRM|nr:hypothetical protein DCCM_0161 [Desulfocucumis palustris]